MNGAELEILLGYYKQIRIETDTAQKNQQTILNWTSIAVGVLLIFSLSLYKENALLAFLFFQIVWPSASFMFLHLWLFEVSKMIRAGRYLFLIEEQLNGFFERGKFPGFEHWLRIPDKEGDKHIKFGYLAGVAIYSGIILFAALIAIIIFWNSHIISEGYEWRITYTFFQLLLTFAIIMKVKQNIRRHILVGEGRIIRSLDK